MLFLPGHSTVLWGLMVADELVTDKRFSLYSKQAEAVVARLDISDFESKILLWLT
jgi:hypothetical protein